MNWKTVRLTLSTTILAFAVALAGWGIYGMRTFEDESGWGYDPRFFIFDSAVAPFFWGCVLLLIGYFMRFHFRLYAVILLAAINFALLGWQRISQRNYQLDADFFTELIAVCAVPFFLMILDRYVQRVYDFVRQKAGHG